MVCTPRAQTLSSPRRKNPRLGPSERGLFWTLALRPDSKQALGASRTGSGFRAEFDTMLRHPTLRRLGGIGQWGGWQTAS